jgi:CheY-like chemotaxis protein
VPETALLDIGLPDMDGYALARRLRAQTNGSLQLVAMTGYGRTEDRNAARDAGFDVHLVKPAEPHELARVLASGN